MANALTLKTFKRLLKDPYNCLVSVQETRQLKVSSRHIGNIDEGIRCLLNVDLKQYSRKQQGTVLAYHNVKILHDTADVVMDLPFILLDISVNLIVFRPRIGDTLRGNVNKVSRDHIGCIVIDNYNASILKPHDEEWDSQKVRIGDIVLFEVTHLYPQGKVTFIKGKLLEVEERKSDILVNADDDGYASALPSAGSLSPMENVITTKAFKKLEASGHGLGRKVYFGDDETNEGTIAHTSQTENAGNISATEMTPRHSELGGIDKKHSRKKKKTSKSKTEEPLRTSVDVVYFDVTDRESHKSEYVNEDDVQSFTKQEHKHRGNSKKKSEPLSRTDILNASDVVHPDKTLKFRLGRKDKCGDHSETHEDKTAGTSQMTFRYSEDDAGKKCSKKVKKEHKKAKKESKREKLLSTSVGLLDSEATERESHEIEGEVELFKTDTSHACYEHSGNHHAQKRKRKSKNNSEKLSLISNLNECDVDNADRKHSIKVKKKRKTAESPSTPFDLVNLNTTETGVSHDTGKMKDAHRKKVKVILMESTSPVEGDINDSVNHKLKHSVKSEMSAKTRGEMSSISNKDVRKSDSLTRPDDETSESKKEHSRGIKSKSVKTEVNKKQKQPSHSKKRMISDVEVLLQTKSVVTTNEHQMRILNENGKVFEGVSCEILDEFEVDSNECKKTCSKTSKHLRSIKRKGTESEFMDKPTASLKFKKRKIGDNVLQTENTESNVSKSNTLQTDNGKLNDSSEISNDLLSVLDGNSELFEKMISDLVSEYTINSGDFKKDKKADINDKKILWGMKRKGAECEFMDQPTSSLSSKQRKIENVLQTKGRDASVSKGNEFWTPRGEPSSCTVESEDLTSILDLNSELLESMVYKVLNESEIKTCDLNGYSNTYRKAKKKIRKEKVEYNGIEMNKKESKKTKHENHNGLNSVLYSKEKHVNGRREDNGLRKQKGKGNDELEKQKTNDNQHKKWKRKNDKLEKRKRKDDKREKQKTKDDHLEKRKRRDDKLQKQNARDDHLEKQKTMGDQQEKRKRKDDRLEKQKTCGKLNKQKRTAVEQEKQMKDDNLEKRKTKVDNLEKQMMKDNQEKQEINDKPEKWKRKDDHLEKQTIKADQQEKRKRKDDQLERLKTKCGKVNKQKRMDDEQEKRIKDDNLEKKKTKVDNLEKKKMKDDNQEKQDKNDKLEKWKRKYDSLDKQTKADGEKKKQRKIDGGRRKEKKVNGELIKEKKVVGERRKEKKNVNGELRKEKKVVGERRKEKKVNGELRKEKKVDGERRKEKKVDGERRKENKVGERKRQKKVDGERKQQKKVDGGRRKEKKVDDERKKQKKVDGERKKQKKVEDERKKQKKIEGERKKQKIKDDELKRKRKKKERDSEKKKGKKKERDSEKKKGKKKERDSEKKKKKSS